MYFTLPLSVIAHLATGQNTPLTHDVLSLSGGFVAKGVVLASLLLGVRGVKKSAPVTHG